MKSRSAGGFTTWTSHIIQCFLLYCSLAGTTSRDCRKQKLQDRDIAMIWAANVFKKTKGGQSIWRTGVHTVRMNFHLPVSRTNISWSGVHFLFWFHINSNCKQSTLIQNIQNVKLHNCMWNSKKATGSMYCMRLNFDVDRNKFLERIYKVKLDWLTVWFNERALFAFFRGEICSWWLFILSVIKSSK